MVQAAQPVVYHARPHLVHLVFGAGHISGVAVVEALVHQVRHHLLQLVPGVEGEGGLVLV